MILGLDVSTSTVGYTIIGLDGKLHAMSYINLKNTKGLFDKLKLVRDELIQFAGMISYVAIEEPVKRFKAGSSKAEIISLLGQFNGMVSALCFFLYNVIPMQYNVNSARSKIGIKFKSGEDRKIKVRDHIKDLYPDIDWPILTKGPNVGNLKQESCDMADSAVVTLAELKRVLSN